jgi:hypothetical protein
VSGAIAHSTEFLHGTRFIPFEYKPLGINPGGQQTESSSGIGGYLIYAHDKGKSAIAPSRNVAKYPGNGSLVPLILAGWWLISLTLTLFNLNAEILLRIGF